MVGGEKKLISISRGGEDEKGRETMVKAMMGKTVDGVVEKLNTGTLHIWPPSTSNSNTHIGEQADPWGQDFPLKEARRLFFWKNDGGKVDGVAGKFNTGIL